MTRSLASMFAVALLATVGIGSSAQAAGPHHIDEVANNLKIQTRAMLSEVRAYFWHSPYATHLIKDVEEMHQLADHIHDVAHFGGGYAHIRNDVRQLDRLFHHVERLVDRLDVKTGHIHGHGHIHMHGGFGHGIHIGFHQPVSRISIIRSRLHLIEDELHHLLHDLN